MGVHSTYTKELAEEVCNYIAEGGLVQDIDKQEGLISHTTVYRWLNRYADFRELYARACECRVEVKVSKIDDLETEMMAAIEECEDPKRLNAIISAYKQRIDNVKWIASKLKSKKYGDRQIHSGDEDDPIRSIQTVNINRGIEKLKSEVPQEAGDDT